MKSARILLFLAILVATLQSRAGSKEIYFSTDNPQATSVGVSAGYEINWYQWNEVGTLTVELPETSNGITININRGYVINEVFIEDRRISGPATSSVFIPNADIPSGSTVLIYAESQAKKEVTIYADPTKVEVNYLYGTFAPEEWDGNQLRIGIEDPYMSILITSSTGYMIKSVLYKGEDVAEGLRREFSIYPKVLPAGENVYDIEVISLESLRESQFTVDVTGDKDAVAVSLAGDRDKLITGDALNRPIRFCPEIDLPVYIQNPEPAGSLYRVTLDDREINESDSESIYKVYDISDGSEINVEVDYPDVMVPIRLEFVNPGTETSISGVTDSHSHVIPRDKWLSEGWSIPMGTLVLFEFNYEDYDLTYTLDGKACDDDYLSLRARNPEGYDVTVTAVPKSPFEVTFFYDLEAPHFKVCIGISDKEYVEMDPESDFTRIPVVRSQNRVRIIPEEGWVIRTLFKGSQKILSDDIEIKDNTTISVFMEEYPRASEAVVYLDPETEWLYKSLTLSPGDTFKSKVLELETGYNVVKFNEADVPFANNFQPAGGFGEDAGKLFIDGEEIEVYDYLMDGISAGSILKAYGNTPASCVVSFDIDPDAGDVTIMRDIISRIDEPATQTVLSGTRFDILPADIRGTVIKVNGMELPVIGDCYVVDVTADVVIRIEKGIPSGSPSIEMPDSHDVYSMQGILLLRGASESQVRSLPKGIYIIGGKKTRN